MFGRSHINFHVFRFFNKRLYLLSFIFCYFQFLISFSLSLSLSLTHSLVHSIHPFIRCVSLLRCCMHVYVLRARERKVCKHGLLLVLCYGMAIAPSSQRVRETREFEIVGATYRTNYCPYIHKLFEMKSAHRHINWRTNSE